MEVICRSKSSATALDLGLISVVESAVMEMLLDAGKSLFWLLCLIGSTPNGADLFGEGCVIIEGFPLLSLSRIKGESMPENKDDGESDEDDEDEDGDDGGEQDDDGGEEEYSADEANEEDDEGDELEANGEGDGGGSEDDDDDDDEDDEDGDDEDDEEDGEDDEDQPPPKKRK